ncbi:hypothetical protein AK812_SmicGene5828 [Symbiodinium microadriaticum]|uniref:Uncharacterized protein n=1 Tax=Symbiodinium microadriaticum TaxID=2951 RepID=A0A1Q9ESN0_SYMMI|nr:hypothetical protein AK812_SmicGene5828 [Symbiodinium microadriaticum]
MRVTRGVLLFPSSPGLSAEATWMPTRARRSRSYTLVDEESADNMVQIFETATGLAEKDAGLNLRKQVVQVHKDYAKGMDPARRRVFPWARPCDDYAHMHRASYKTLESHTLAFQDPGKELTGNQKAAFKFMNRLITLTRLLPTLNLFDAVWRTAFPWLERVGRGPSVEHLKTTYFEEIAGRRSLNVVQLGEPLPGHEAFLFAGIMPWMIQ